VKTPEAFPQFLGRLKKRPDLIIFGLGVLLFVGGLGGLIPGERAPARPVPTAAIGGTGTSKASTSGRVGPAPGEQVGPYIQAREALLAKRKVDAPKSSSPGLVVFESYRTVAQAEDFLKRSKLPAVSVKMRVPLGIFRPVEVTLGKRSLSAAVQGLKDPIRRELKELEEVSRQVTEPSFKAVYTKDIELNRQALALLDGNAATIFALVVEGSNANLAAAAAIGGVRYVDVPDDEGATTGSIAFVALLPEDTETADSAFRV
jgi:hypothetical protein